MDSAVDALVLAGDRGAARPVGHLTKSLLPLGGRPLLAHVIGALARVERVHRILVVGPHDALGPLLSNLSPGKPLELLEQGATAFDNFWAGFSHLGRGQPENPDRPVLVLAADTPLITPQEINEFLDGCDLQTLDFCIGMTDAAHLARYYNTPTQAGIHMRYLHLADGSLRLNNLHLLKPLRVANRGYIQEIYELRYQRDLRNMIRAAWDLFRQPGIGWRSIYLYTLLQLAELGEGLGWPGLRDWFRRRITREDVTRIASAVLQTRAGIVETTTGGCAIDVDNAEDYAILQARWQEFSERLPPPR